MHKVVKYKVLLERYHAMTLPTTSTSTSSADELCRDTLNFLDMDGGSCEDYALPANVEWCGVYGNDGEDGMTLLTTIAVCVKLLFCRSRRRKRLHSSPDKSNIY